MHREHLFAGDPVLVDRDDARAILGVTASTFARLCREGRFEVWNGLYRGAELRAYRARDKRRGASPKSVTNADLTSADFSTNSTRYEPRVFSKFSPHKRKLVRPGNAPSGQEAPKNWPLSRAADSTAAALKEREFNARIR
jgi:hypothetical protein